ncbi:MBL fold metallo-hydrolase [Ammoniphilus sp. CFH 90114]|uniref:MBL fold metallo-hydrolase n=1 Tax=Ammoniphilus sp. CFH 90114 TaxID=2493665 RepID=UPI00100FDE32|nr:MBL fold metallo-hydrolase [Ammoniphilus sp. CFH 90114]RXT07153.1 MBL fold metallo-hydrolase [Ammoniphilus sp. CFH 90114]
MIILTTVILVILTGYLFLTYYPAFGGRGFKERMKRSVNYSNGKFVNMVPTPMEMNAGTMVSLVRDYIKGNPNRRPKQLIPMKKPAILLTNPDKHQPTITWLGHSAFILEINGKRLLLDPMLGMAPSPLPSIGGKRYSEKPPVEVEDIPPIDAVLLSHDHYDHLDYGTILKLKPKVRTFITPLGVGAHLERWGVDPSKIIELDWWEEWEFEGILLACTPARHFSGRSIGDRNTTLWCSWVIEFPQARLYFSGDSGYGPHFKEIGERYGPFDLTMMECGQYDERWRNIHMMPEETVQAHLDVKGRVLIPIHWGAFTLSLHDWTDPIERVSQAAKEKGAVLSTPPMGETIPIYSARYSQSRWWVSTDYPLKEKQLIEGN